VRKGDGISGDDRDSEEQLDSGDAAADRAVVKGCMCVCIVATLMLVLYNYAASGGV
jgi:hypothetical protein